MAFGQGTVNFSNASTAVGDTTKLNHWSDTAQAGVVLAPGLNATPISFANSNLVAGGLVSSNAFPSLRAQLYWGASTANSLASLTAVTGPAAFFRSTTSVNVGSWNGGNRTVDQWVAGEHHELAVIVWDSSKATDGLAAMAGLANGSYQGLFASSSLFDYAVPGILDPPSAALLANLQGFNIANYAIIPEPTTFSLAALGGAAILFLRRRK